MTEEGLELGRTTHRAPPTGAAVDAMEHANARAGSPSSAVVSALGSGGLHCIRNVQRADPLGGLRARQRPVSTRRHHWGSLRAGVWC